MDLKRRRPARITEEIADLYPRPGGDKSLFFKEIKIHDNYDSQKEFSVGFLDIDYYRHANNSVYLRWAINSINFDFLEKNRMEEIDILYKKEVVLGDDVVVKTKILKDTVNQVIYNKRGDLLTKIESKWIARGD
jgi:medium-chain acyl-[acyl-carrier-protein] hydrolase